MNFFRNFLFIIFSVFIFCAPLSAMEQKLDAQPKQIKIFVMAYSMENSKTVVLGKLENDLWMPFHSTLLMDELKKNARNNSVAKAIFYKETKIDISAAMFNILKIEAATIVHQQTFGLFAKKEKGLKDISDLEGMKFLKDRIEKEGGYYVEYDKDFAIFFIRVPYIESNVFQELNVNIKQKSSGSQSSGSASVNKDPFIWLELEELNKYIFDDSDLAKILQTDEIKNEIAKLKK